MIDLSSATLLTLREAAKLLPGRPHLSTLHRWRLRGVKEVRLETIMIGGRRFTSTEALARFAAETTVVADGDSTHPASPKVRCRRVERAEQELRQLGI